MRRRILDDIYQIEFVDKIDTIAGDICIVDNNTLDKLFVTADSVNGINPKQYTPIGVVVVPASHTDDGTARIISLAFMNYMSPDSGRETLPNEKFYWGGYGFDIDSLDNLVYFPIIADDIENFPDNQTLIRFDDVRNTLAADFSTDCVDVIGSEYENPYLKGTYFNTITGPYAPSPYLEDGSKNPIYHDKSNTGNVLADMNGKSNTEKILAVDNSYSTDWQTASTIQNTGDNQYIHPAAQCCWRYHTVGTNQGDWYLPAVGELGYLYPKYNIICNSINNLTNKEFEVINNGLREDFPMFSSNEINELYVYEFFLNRNGVSFSEPYKNTYVNSHYARAFLKV